MSPELPATISSLECVSALRKLGFRVERSNASTVTMTSPSHRHVFVPRKELSRNELRVLLLFADVDALEFLTAAASASPTGSTSGLRLKLGLSEDEASEPGTGRQRSS